MTEDRKTTADKAEQEIAIMVRELNIAADALTSNGHGPPANAIRLVARAGEGNALHECSAELASQLEGLNPFGRVLALGGIYDVSKIVGETGAERGTGSFLADLLFQCKALYPMELERAIQTHDTMARDRSD